MKISKKLLFAVLAAVLSLLTARADYPVHYDAEFIGNAGNGTFAPYYISANRHGILTQARGAMVHAGAWRPMEPDRRFSYGFGVDIYAGVTSSTDYNRWEPTVARSFLGRWNKTAEHPANLWLQQAYASLKYRSLYVTAGMKDRGSYMLDSSLSSGDMIESGNARSIPQVRVGFIDFQNIPYTRGWLQIQAEAAYGFYCQNSWLDHHFNCYRGIKTVNMLFDYKRIYFRTDPSKPFSATFGAQGAGQFGGTSYVYADGVLVRVDRHSRSLKTFWQMLVPEASESEGYYEGQHLGSWDIKLRYRLRDNTEISAYVQNLWEDGSGMGKLNGWDGLWGLEYKAPEKGWVDGAVIEYLQTTDQSGPLHWDPADAEGTTLDIGHATGCDNYYNNRFYGPYANLGMAQGNPLLKSPIFYPSGDFTFNDNRVRAFHVGVTGTPVTGLAYRVLLGHRVSWGSFDIPRLQKLRSTSLLVEVKYTLPTISAMDIKGELGMDRGGLTGNNTGVCVTLSYKGLLNF